jgi:DcmR-like sensory protein
MNPPPFTRLEGRIPIAAHQHVAVLYRGREQAFRLASFLAEGLGRGDRSVYLAPVSQHAEMLARLERLGADPKRQISTGGLRVEVGESGWKGLQALAEKTFADAEQAGAPGVRWLEDGGWAASAGFPKPRFFEFHALLNYQVKHYPSVALCQYDLGQIDTRDLFSSIAVHRHLLLEETLVRDNPFYIPAEKFIPLSPQERERDLVKLFREVGFDVERLLETLAGYGSLHGTSDQGS